MGLISTEQNMGMAVSRLHIPGHRFVVVSDPAVLPDIIGRPGLPKWAAYENVIPVSTRCGRHYMRSVHCPVQSLAGLCCALTILMPCAAGVQKQMLHPLYSATLR